MKTVAQYGGLAAIAAGVFCILVAIVLALSAICGEGAAACHPSADGTPWIITGLALFISGAALMGWGDD